MNRISIKFYIIKLYNVNYFNNNTNTISITNNINSNYFILYSTLDWSIVFLRFNISSIFVIITW